MERFLYNLPIYDMTITDETVGLYTVSLVDDPAMEVGWYAFSKDAVDSKVNVKCSEILDEMERKVMVVICRADFPILRKNADGEFIYIQFPKDTIKLMSQRFLKNGFQTAVNVMHEEDSYINGVEMEQLFIKDVAAGIDPVHFKDIEDGSLFAVYKVENDSIWKDIVDGKYTSVSLEGLFTPVLAKPKQERELNTIDDLVGILK